MKICIKCKAEKDLECFYKHSKMSDGHLNKCKSCCKEDATKRTKLLSENKEWLDRERARGREKYYRLNYKDKHKSSKEKKDEIIRRYKEKYPEKQSAKQLSKRLPKSNKDNHLHHWSYREEHWKDVIELSVVEHNLLHRFIVYDQDEMLYRDGKGNLLTTRESHINLLEHLKN